MKKKINIKFIVIALILIISIVLFFVLTKKQANNVFPSPTPITFQFEKVLPKEGNIEIAFPSTAIIFYFNSPLDISKSTILINPEKETEISVSADKKQLIVRPIQPWSMNTNYQIKLSVTSVNSTTVFDQTFNFNFKSPTDSPMIK